MYKVFKKNIYRIKRVVQCINYLRNNFNNWDEIIKRATNGKSTRILFLKSGLKIKGVDNNTLSIYKEVFINKVYNPKGFTIEENSTVFDVGANVGVFSLFASRIKGVKVFSFEPHPTNFSVLEENIHLNSLNNINAFQVGLGKDNELRTLIIGEIPGGHKVSNGNEVPGVANTLTIETRTLGSFISSNKIDEIDFLKLDCEGAEGEILDSLDSNTLAKIKKIVIEFHDNHSILNHDQIVEKLNNEGFVTEMIWNKKSFFGYIYASK